MREVCGLIPTRVVEIDHWLVHLARRSYVFVAILPLIQLQDPSKPELPKEVKEGVQPRVTHDQLLLTQSVERAHDPAEVACEYEGA